MSRAEELIGQLHLEPHPEGGFFREVYRSELRIDSPVINQTRNAVTSIYFLLCKDQISRFHRVLHEEMWHFFEGAALTLIQATPSAESCREILLGPQANDCVYQHCIPAGHWQAARTTGDYTLVGCTVAPGFDFQDFMFLKDSPECAAVLNDQHPDYSHLL